MQKFTLCFLVFFLYLFSANYISAQLETTWVKTLYYDSGTSQAQTGFDTLKVGPDGFATRPDGKFFVLNNDHKYQDQSIYLMDSLGSIITSQQVGYYLTLQEWDSYGIVSTPDSGCAYIEHYYDFGGPLPQTVTYKLKKLSKSGGSSTVYTWSNIGFQYPPVPRKIIPSYHNTYYIFFNDTVIEYPGQDTIMNSNLTFVFKNDQMLYSDSSFSRITYQDSVIWSVPRNGYQIVAASENYLYAARDSLRKYDAITGQLLWSRFISFGNLYSYQFSNDGLAIINGRSLTVLDSSGFVVATNYIGLPYRNPRTLSSLPDGSLLTGGGFRSPNSMFTIGTNYSSFVIKLNSEGHGTIDSTDYFFSYDADIDSLEEFVDDAVVVAAALGNSNGHPEINYVGWRGYTYYSADWSGRFKSGLNYKYSDANFDGVIDTSDIRLIDYPAFTSQRNNAPPIHIDTTNQENIYISIDDTTFDIGDTVTICVILGTPTDPIDSIYGISFRVGISGIILNTLSVDYINGTLGDTLSNLYKYISWNGSHFNAMVLCRTDHQNISIAGDTIFKYNAVINTLWGPGPYQLGFSGHLLTEGGYTIPYQYGADSIQISLNISVEKERTFRLFPNPADDWIKVSDQLINKLKIIDISGALILESEVSDGLPINIKDLPEGLYLLELINSKYSFFEKLIVIH